MITKTKLGEDIDLLLERISLLQDEVNTLSMWQHTHADTMMDFIVMVDSMIKLLSEKNILTAEEYKDKIAEVTKFAEIEKVKVSEVVRNKYKDKYHTWLLTQSKNYGNA
jgi:predicted XRE-type DNA-binding protein